MDQRGNSVPFSGWLADPNRVVGLVYPPSSITMIGDRIWVGSARYWEERVIQRI